MAKKLKKISFADCLDALTEYGLACQELAEKAAAPPLIRNVTEADREKMRLAKLKCLQLYHNLMP